MAEQSLPAYFRGRERLETWALMRRTVRMGAPDELAVGDLTRVVEHLRAGRGDQAAAYLRCLHPGNLMMVEVSREWCLRTYVELARLRGGTDADRVAADAETEWLRVLGLDAGMMAIPALRTQLSAAWLKENAAAALAAKRTRTLSISNPAVTGELESLFSAAVAATGGSDREAAVGAAERYHRHACACHDALIAYLWAFADAAARAAGEDVAERALNAAFKSTPTVNLLWPALHMLTAEDAAFALAEHLRGHFSGPDRAGAVRIVEEPDRYRLVMDPCGSGGAMRRRIQGTALQGMARRAKPSAASWGLSDVPVYCMHCAHNEIRSARTIGFPRWVTDYDPDPAKPCEWVIYKRPEDIPDRYFSRIGVGRRPDQFEKTGGLLGKLRALAGGVALMVRAR